MPYVTTRKISTVTHIGHLDRGRGERQPTADGPGIAVSTRPEDWRAIKGLNGPEHQLSYPPAQWLDALSFDGGDIEELISWMLSRSYMRAVTTWTVTYYDAAQDDFVEFASKDRAAAAQKVGRSLIEEIAAAERGEGAVLEEDGYQLERRAMARLGGVSHWPDPLNWFDAAVLLYAREVVLEKRPFVVGVWWDQPRSREAELSDYGVLFPERAHLFEVEDEDGEMRRFGDAFPECPGLSADAA